MPNRLNFAVLAATGELSASRSARIATHRAVYGCFLASTARR
jgi:hypothetical protein